LAQIVVAFAVALRFAVAPRLTRPSRRTIAKAALAVTVSPLSVKEGGPCNCTPPWADAAWTDADVPNKATPAPKSATVNGMPTKRAAVEAAIEIDIGSSFFGRMPWPRGKYPGEISGHADRTPFSLLGGRTAGTAAARSFARCKSRFSASAGQPGAGVAAGPARPGADRGLPSARKG